MSDAELIRQLRYEADANAAEVRRLTCERDGYREATDILQAQFDEAMADAEKAVALAQEAQRERDEARRASDALIQLIRQHRCNCDGVMSVGECVDSGLCGCSAALLTRAISTGEG
jgi:hypothetical protein